MADVIDEIQAAGLPVEGERLSLGVAARLSRYLQVLTQARKMGRETISSQELSEYTHINPTQIRRDLSGFGKFGKRGVGYNVDSLVSLHTEGYRFELHARMLELIPVIEVDGERVSELIFEPNAILARIGTLSG